MPPRPAYAPRMSPESPDTLEPTIAAAPDTMSSSTVARVLRGQLCTGCGLCAGVSDGAIRMAIDAAGFSRPVELRPVAADTERLIDAACPGARLAAWSAFGDEQTIHPYWGPIHQCLTGHASDEKVRFAGSSGGALSALAIHALAAGLVDAVAHIGVAETDPLANQVALSRTAGAVVARAGSRYAPSPVLESIGALLDSNARYLLIGKPCDISALRQLAKVDTRVDARFPLMLSFFCGGLPSIKGTHAIIDAMGQSPEAVHRFRYRGNGWPGTAEAEAKDGTVATMSYADSWGRHLSSRVQYRCKICPDAVGGVADIACADAWYGGESGYPQFDEADGRSLILTRSAAGEALLAAALAAGAVAVQSLPVAEIDLMQPAQARRKRLVAARSLAARLLFQPQPSMRGLSVGAAARRASITETVRNLAGSALRIVRGRK